MKKICLLGLGYIGLPTAALFATRGYKVVGVDINNEKVEEISKGIVYFDEIGLKDLVREALDSGNLTLKNNVEEADIFIIAVPTPLNEKQKKPDLEYVKSAAEMIKEVLKKRDLIILESTVPPNTSRKILIPILNGSSAFKDGVDYYLAHCPERAIPGNTIYELINNDRIIGGIDKTSCEKAKEVYSHFVKGKMYLTDITVAETIKLMENTYRDINIALANEFAKISEEIGINVWEAIELANKHPRVNILNPGPGVGGHCIAVDPWFLVEDSIESKIIKLAREINNSMPEHVIYLIEKTVKDIKNPTITILGVAYKKNVDDTRNTPALEIIRLAKNRGWRVKIHDPLVKKFKYPLLNLNDALEDTDCAVIVTDHDVYKEIDLSGYTVVDTRNIGIKARLLGDGTIKNLVYSNMV